MIGKCLGFLKFRSISQGKPAEGGAVALDQRKDISKRRCQKSRSHYSRFVLKKGNSDKDGDPEGLWNPFLLQTFGGGERGGNQEKKPFRFIPEEGTPGGDDGRTGILILTNSGGKAGFERSVAHSAERGRTPQGNYGEKKGHKGAKKGHSASQTKKEKKKQKPGTQGKIQVKRV